MLAILTTHPIQYQVPLWQALARESRVPFEVWYLADHGTRVSFDRGFGRSFSWDLDTLSGYAHRFLRVNEQPDVSRFRGVRLRESFTGLLEKHQVRVLWVNGWQVQAYWEAVWRAHASGVKVWLRAESNDLAEVPVWKRPLKRLLLSRFFARVDDFLYIGSANRRLYEKYGVDEPRLHESPYAVDHARFARQADSLRPLRAALRESWRIPADAFCILFVGKFVPKKHAMHVIEAAGLLSQKERGRKVHLLMVGAGELGPQLRAACHVEYDAEEPHAVRGPGVSGPAASFTGFLNQQDISKAYVAADCLVLPSDARETWGLVVNEAMASGTPAIVSNRCGCAEDLIPADRRYPFGDREGLARVLENVICGRGPVAHPDGHTLEQTVRCVDQLYRVRVEA